VIKTPFCGNYECNNRVPLDRWVWTAGSVLTCSPECAQALANEGRRAAAADKSGHLLKRCARPGCHGVVGGKANRFCSARCAAKVQYGDKPEGGATVRLAPGDRWEQVAPEMHYSDALKDYEARALFLEEIKR